MRLIHTTGDLIFCRSFINDTFTVHLLSVSLNNRWTTLLFETRGMNAYIQLSEILKPCSWKCDYD